MNFITWFKSIDGAGQVVVIIFIVCICAMLWLLFSHNYGAYHEEELERGSIVENGNLVAYYRIVKVFYMNGRTKIKTERINLP